MNFITSRQDDQGGEEIRNRKGEGVKEGKKKRKKNAPSSQRGGVRELLSVAFFFKKNWCLCLLARTIEYMGVFNVL